MIYWLIIGVLIGFLIGVKFMNWWYPKNVGKSAYTISMAEHYCRSDWAKAIVACHAYHLPGDCVLCGGEAMPDFNKIEIKPLKAAKGADMPKKEGGQ